MSSKLKTTSSRNSSIELLKIIALISIVLSHVIQTLSEPNSIITASNYLLNITSSTTDIQTIILAILRCSGAFGNIVFFVCSAWFLVDSDRFNKRKWATLFLNVWVISVAFLVGTFVVRKGDIALSLIAKSVFPTFFQNNWFLTCYLFFYPIHPLLNNCMKWLGQKRHLTLTIALIMLYSVLSMIKFSPYSNNLIIWIAIYFAVGYMKFYLKEISSKLSINVAVLLVSVIAQICSILAINFIGLKISAFDNHLYKMNADCNPFFILIALSLLNLARNVELKNKFVNYISSLSLFVYLTHENILLRTYYRPLLWMNIYEKFGYNYVLLWALAMAVAIFVLAVAVSVVYKASISKLVDKFVAKAYPIFANFYHKIQALILSIH